MSRRSGHFTRVNLDSPSHSRTPSYSTSSIQPLSPSPAARPSHHAHHRSKRIYLAAAALLLALVALLHGRHFPSKLDMNSWSDKSSNGLSKILKGHSASRRITLIAMWDDNYPATYLPSFFKSAARNADAVDLLWINVMRQSDSCLDISSYIEGTTNIKAICISDQEDKRMIRDYLCETWQCTEDQVKAVDEHMKTRKDPIHCEFKPMRGSIYRQWVNTKWWAWVDADQLIGNFKDIWPWHVIDNFDVATISEWDIGNIYLRGQFTAFQLSNPKTDTIWLKYPPLSSPESLPTLGHGPLDEFDYSVFYSNTLKSEINWILLPRILGADKFGSNKLISNGKRVFYIPEDMKRRDISILLLNEERFNPKTEPAFAAVEEFDVEKWAVPVRELREGDYVNGKPLWPWCVQPETRCTVMRESYWHSSTLMRYNGKLLEYFDLRSRPRAQKREIFFGIEEKLFIHFQEIKRREWFKLPPNGIGEDEILEIRDESVTMWNKHTLKTTFEALNPNVEKYPSNDNEILAHGYQSVNGSDEMPLPVGVLNALLP